MFFRCSRSVLRGAVDIPASKSHTIRACAIAAMASGESTIQAPLVSQDALAAVAGVTALGARVDRGDDRAWRISGCGGRPRLGRDIIDVGNSGTTLRVLMGLAGLLPRGESVVLTGDRQIQRRPAGPLAGALADLGAEIALEGRDGCPPVRVGGRLRGGETTLEAPTSQYVSSLLLACPLAERDSTVVVTLLNERPYVQITLDWLARQGIAVRHDQMTRFHVPGGQRYRPFTAPVPADFSSASFFLAAGALPGNSVTCRGLDMTDSQPDKAVVDYLRQMGARIAIDGANVTVTSERLRGAEFDMNETPDALPVMAVVACFADGETRLRNVAHARIKETDRIAVMCRELRALGADIDELPDGLVIRASQLHGAPVEGHGDHRVVMALALAGLASPGATWVSEAESAAVTFPGYHRLMASLGGDVTATPSVG